MAKSQVNWNKLASRLDNALALADDKDLIMDPSTELTSCSTCDSTDFSVDSDVFHEDYWNLDLSDLVNDDLDMPTTRTRLSEQTKEVGYSSYIVKRLLPQDASALPMKRLIAPTRTDTDTPRIQKGTIRRSVSFSKVEIRVFERILADNPSCGEGPSLGLGWKYIEKQPVELEKFETKRKTQLCYFRRRSIHDFQLSASKREKVAKKWGYTKEDIQNNIKQIQKVQKQRVKTVKNLASDLEKESSNNATAIFEKARRLHRLIRPRDASASALQGKALTLSARI